MSDGFKLERTSLTPDEVAEHWDCTAAHVRNLIRDRKLRAFRIGARILRIPIDAVAEYERAAEISPIWPTSAASAPSSEADIVITHTRSRRRSAK